MGTRSLTVVQDEQGKELITMYRQYDGYPSGHGKDLAEFLSGFTIVNGMSSRDPVRIANGMGCLAAQLVAHFKTEPGNIYLYPPKSRDCGEEYVYIVSKPKGDKTLRLTVQAGSMTFFGLPGTKQKNMPVIYDGTPDDFGDGSLADSTFKGLAASVPNDYLDAQKAKG